MRKKKKIFDKGRYLVDESHRGCYTDESKAIVMDNALSRDPKTLNKKKVSYVITQNTQLWAGLNTVAVFKIKKRQAEPAAQ